MDIWYLISYKAWYLKLKIWYLISDYWYLICGIWSLISDTWFFILETGFLTIDILFWISITWYLIPLIPYSKIHIWQKIPRLVIFNTWYLILDIPYMKVNLSFGHKTVKLSLSKPNIESKKLFYKSCPVWFYFWLWHKKWKFAVFWSNNSHFVTF